MKAKENTALRTATDERGAWISASEEFPELGNHPHGWSRGGLEVVSSLPGWEKPGVKGKEQVSFHTRIGNDP